MTRQKFQGALWCSALGGLLMTYFKYTINYYIIDYYIINTNNYYITNSIY